MFIGVKKGRVEIVKTIFNELEWTTEEVGGGAASNVVELSVGRIGTSGPKVTLLAGVHGDEGPWGALAIREALSLASPSLTGQLQVVLAANPLAAEADARSAPLDHLDLNRSFPGDASGSHTERLANLLAQHLADSDVVVDLHGGGSWCVNAFVFAFPEADDLATCFDAPFLTRLSYRPGTLTGYAHEHGCRAVAVEMGGRSRDEIVWCKRISQGITRLLVHSGAVDTELKKLSVVPVEVQNMAVIRPNQGGVFVPKVREEAVGTTLSRGTVLGMVYDLNTYTLLEELVAPYDTTALLLVRPHVTVLDGGAMTYVVAEPK